MVEIGDKLTNSIDKKLVLRQTLERQTLERKTLEPTNPRKRQTIEKMISDKP